jgi:hypothetical protein
MKSTQVFIMSYSNIINRSILLLLPFLFTGCYTQFQSLDDRFPVKDKEYSQYYEWDGHEEARAVQTSDSLPSTTAYNEEKYREEEQPLEENNIYYIDYEAKRWYEEHYANNLFWEGYDVGYADGYADGWRNLYPMSAQFSMNRYRFYRGYTGAFEYYGFYRNPSYINFMWFNYGGFPYNTYYTGFFGQWGYYGPYYNGYWGHPYYAYNNYAYINHNRNRRYRNADIYRKGPRNSGLTNRTDGRTRDGRLKNTNSGKRSRGSVIRTRSTNNTSRVRGNNSSRVRRGSSGTVGRSRGSSVGKTRGSSGSSRSRGSSSSVGKRSSGSSNGTSRSGGGRGSNLNDTSTRYDLGNLGSNGRTFTIPSRKVPIHTRTNTKRTKSRFSLGDLLFGPTNSTGNFRPSTSGSSIRGSHYTPKTRSTGSTVKRSNRGHSSKSKTVRSSVKRSSSSKSTRSRSRGSSSSSSSKKRSRGNN